jgi:hypothetical protein
MAARRTWVISTDAGTAAVVFATGRGKAKKIAVTLYDLRGFTKQQLTADPAPEYDAAQKFVDQDYIPADILIRKYGWWYYCEECGRSVVTAKDLAAGDAIMVHRRPFCIPCAIRRFGATYVSTARLLMR